MCPKILIVLTLAASMLAARADEKFSTLQVDGETYNDVTVTKVTATDIYFFHSQGMANAKIKDLSPELQKHFHFDPVTAKVVAQKQADDQVKYHAALLHQPAPQRPDTAHDADDAAHSSEAVWRSDFPGALKQAQSEKKMVLLDFTGSDWCPWCIRFEREVLSTPKFGTYADQNLELVKVDFPQHTPLPADQQRANRALAKQFNVDGYPTYVLLNSSGQETWRQVGYAAGGADAFVGELKKYGGR